MSSQKFIGRNRAPRVQIEYDVELYGAEKKVQLPFVMGVLADLSGNAGKEQAPMAERKFLEVSVDNFDDRLKGVAPRVKMEVSNKLTGDGNIKVELGFEKLADFSPAQIARQVPALAQLLEARTQLANLITYMDGKSGAEDLIAKVLHDKGLLESLAANAKAAAEAAAAAKAAEKPAEG